MLAGESGLIQRDGRRNGLYRRLMKITPKGVLIGVITGMLAGMLVLTMGHHQYLCTATKRLRG